MATRSLNWAHAVPQISGAGRVHPAEHSAAADRGRVGTAGAVMISVSPFWHVLCSGEDLRPGPLQWSCPVIRIHGCPGCCQPSPKLLVQGPWACASEARAACGPRLPMPLPSPGGPLPPNPFQSNPSKMFGCSSLSLVCMVKGLLLKHFSQLETFIGLSFMLKKSWQP